MTELCAFWLIYSLVASVFGNDLNCFNKRKDDDRKTICKAINITCPRGTVIYNPEVVASSANCSNGNSLSGDSKPCVGIPFDLKKDLADCFWRRTCLVRFPSTLIINITHQTCLKAAKSLIVRTLRCIKKSTSNYFGEICNNGKSGKPGEIGRQASSGVILSHTLIPWNYKKASEPCIININNRLDGKTFTHIEVDFFDIDIENDILEIQKEKITDKSFKQTYNPNTAVSIKFSKSHFSKSGSGFVICFKKTVGDKAGQVSACKGLVTEGEGTATLATSSDVLCEYTFFPQQITSTADPFTSKRNRKKRKCKKCDKCTDKRGKCNKRCRKCCKKKCKRRRNNRNQIKIDG